jgi:hypothetical protein
LKSAILKDWPVFTSVMATLNQDGIVGAATSGIGSK